MSNLNKIFLRSAFLFLVTASLIGCETKTPEAQQNVTTEEVAEDTEKYIGQTVTIRSNALKRIEPTTFTVAEQEFFGGENIVVVNASGEPFVLPADDGVEVQITGKVTKFLIGDIESAYDLDLNPDLYVDYTEKPAIIAQSLALAPEPGEITSDPAQYYGKTLAVTGEIEQMYDEEVFTLDEDRLFGASDLLVLATNLQKSVSDGETVAVTGQLRSFVLSEIERDYDLTWDLDLQKKIEAEYYQKPVLIVDAVYPSAIPR
ncbi:MAG: hypothetical protein ACFBSE_17440 [Prochloraceae cyanobacterium]